MAAASLSSRATAPRSPCRAAAASGGRPQSRPCPFGAGCRAPLPAAHVAAGSKKAFRLAASGPRAFPWGVGTADFQWTANGRLRNQRGRRLFKFQVGVVILSDVMTTWAGGGRRLFRLKKKEKSRRPKKAAGGFVAGWSNDFQQINQNIKVSKNIE